jgi:hypothetical protein
VRAILLTCLTWLWPPTAADAQADLERVREMVAQELQLETGDIEVSGRLTSAKTAFLQDVAIDIEVRELGDVTSGISPRRRVLVADKDFVIMEQQISSISMVFSKDGYYSTTWSYNFSPNTPRRNPDGVEVFELEVVLTPKPVPAPLRKIEGFARTVENGSVEKVITAPSEPAPVPLSGEALRAWKAKRNAGPELMLEGQVDGQGRFVIGQYTPRGQNHTVDGLQQGWLRVSGGAAGDGFVRFNPEEISHRPALGLRSMQEAPVSGYVDALELGTGQGDAVVYFYCRIGGQYGKGMVSGQPYVVEGEDGRVAAAKVTVFLNPTGSRDVSYIHH